MPLEIGTPFGNRIFFSLKDIPDSTVKKILKELKAKDMYVFTSKITEKSKIVASFLDRGMFLTAFSGSKNRNLDFLS